MWGSTPMFAGVLWWVVACTGLIFITSHQKFQMVWNVFIIEALSYRYTLLRHKLLELNVYFRWETAEMLWGLCQFFAAAKSEEWSRKTAFHWSSPTRLNMSCVLVVGKELHCLHPWRLHVWAWGAVQGLPWPSSRKPLEWSQSREEQHGHCHHIQWRRW